MGLLLYDIFRHQFVQYLSHRRLATFILFLFWRGSECCTITIKSFWISRKGRKEIFFSIFIHFSFAYLLNFNRFVPLQLCYSRKRVFQELSRFFLMGLHDDKWKMSEKRKTHKEEKKNGERKARKLNAFVAAPLCQTFPMSSLWDFFFLFFSSSNKYKQYHLSIQLWKLILWNEMWKTRFHFVPHEFWSFIVECWAHAHLIMSMSAN